MQPPMGKVAWFQCVSCQLTLTWGQWIFSYLSNPDWSIQISRAPDVCKVVLHFSQWCYTWTALLSANQNRVIFTCILLLLYNKSLNDWSLGEQWILFPSNLRKQNPLLLKGPVDLPLKSAKGVFIVNAAVSQQRGRVVRAPDLKSVGRGYKSRFDR